VLPEGSSQTSQEFGDAYGQTEKVVDTYYGKEGPISAGDSVMVEGKAYEVKAVTAYGRVVIENRRFNNMVGPEKYGRMCSGAIAAY